jgi:hypothetical protein
MAMVKKSQKSTVKAKKVVGKKQDNKTKISPKSPPNVADLDYFRKSLENHQPKVIIDDFLKDVKANQVIPEEMRQSEEVRISNKNQLNVPYLDYQAGYFAEMHKLHSKTLDDAKQETLELLRDNAKYRQLCSLYSEGSLELTGKIKRYKHYRTLFYIAVALFAVLAFLIL